MASEQYRLSLLHSPVDPVTNSERMSKQQSPPTETVTDDCELNKHLTSGTHHFSAAEKESFLFFFIFFSFLLDLRREIMLQTEPCI